MDELGCVMGLGGGGGGFSVREAMAAHGWDHREWM